LPTKDEWNKSSIYNNLTVLEAAKIMMKKNAETEALD